MSDLSYSATIEYSATNIALCDKTIDDWAMQSGIKFEADARVIIDRETWLPSKTFRFETVQDRTLFLLRWDGQFD